jgi:hypothetical protein
MTLEYSLNRVSEWASLSRNASQDNPMVLFMNACNPCPMWAGRTFINKLYNNQDKEVMDDKIENVLENLKSFNEHRDMIYEQGKKNYMKAVKEVRNNKSFETSSSYLDLVEVPDVIGGPTQTEEELETLAQIKVMNKFFN